MVHASSYFYTNTLIKAFVILLPKRNSDRLKVKNPMQGSQAGRGCIYIQVFRIHTPDLLVFSTLGYLFISVVGRHVLGTNVWGHLGMLFFSYLSKIMCLKCLQVKYWIAFKIIILKTWSKDMDGILGNSITLLNLLNLFLMYCVSAQVLRPVPALYSVFG